MPLFGVKVLTETQDGFSRSVKLFERCEGFGQIVKILLISFRIASLSEPRLPNVDDRLHFHESPNEPDSFTIR
jgi:hypothetical protein